jgi:hypothetical protein
MHLRKKIVIRMVAIWNIQVERLPLTIFGYGNEFNFRKSTGAIRDDIFGPVREIVADYSGVI